MKDLVGVAAMTLVAGSWALAVGSNDESANDAVLRGLESVEVTVEVSGESADQYGLLQRSLEEMAKQLLRRQDLSVPIRETAGSVSNRPQLIVRVNTIDLTGARTAGSIAVELREQVRLTRTNTTVRAITWRESQMLTGLSRRDFGTAAMNGAYTILNRFIREYETANQQAGGGDWVTAEVVYQQIEGGFWGLVASDGRKYRPTSLPRRYRREGLRVQVRIEPQEDQMGFVMWGTAVRILDIRRSGGGENGQDDSQARWIDAEVTHQSIEGGFYGLVGSDGRKYLPSRLPQEFRRNGLRVRARIRPREGIATIQMWGQPVEVLEIERRDVSGDVGSAEDSSGRPPRQSDLLQTPICELEEKT